MVKNSILFKIFIRYLKEKGLSKLLVNNIMHYHFSYIVFNFTEKH